MNHKFSSNTPAYLLVAHGSSDRNYQIALEKLATSVREQLETRIVEKKTYNSRASNVALLNKPQSPIVVTAQLESTFIPLSQTILQLASKLQKSGIKRLRILPLFLLPGIHVKEDIPAEIRIARQRLKGSISLELLDYLGGNSSLINLIETEFGKLPASERILISHGSRRQGGNRPCQEIASKLKANTAYCTVSPSLRETVTKIIADGSKKIAIVPYFLFAGKILKSIATEIEELKQEFPNTEIFLGQPLAATRELASFIVFLLIRQELLTRSN